MASAQGNEALTFESGRSSLLVYRSQFAGTNQATAFNVQVGDEIDRTIAGLKERGVKFEHYDFPGVTRAGDVHLMCATKAAWFKDPDGNIVALVGR